jgi:hypothetical protein
LLGPRGLIDVALMMVTIDQLVILVARVDKLVVGRTVIGVSIENLELIGRCHEQGKNLLRKASVPVAHVTKLTVIGLPITRMHSLMMMSPWLEGPNASTWQQTFWSIAPKQALIEAWKTKKKFSEFVVLGGLFLA